MPTLEPSSVAAPHVDAVRRFNRFYTRRIGALGEELLRTRFSLTEARVVYELAQRAPTTATALGEALGIDPGYLSRILRGFQERGLLERRPSPSDGRQQLLALTDDGRAAFRELDDASQRDVATMLARLTDLDRERLVEAMRRVEALLQPAPPPAEPFTLRTHRPGDLGWVVQRHGELYHAEYGWGERFEALVARTVVDFVEQLDPARERCWIAERDGERVGCIFVVRHPERDGVARLRLFLIEPHARGLGLGRRLVQEVTRFARGAGYHTITLWTQQALLAARHLYREEGYRLVHEEPHLLFGSESIAETWELAL
jgi:DNA-binding MarR family transcriptional regulator/GNAT superfamily N-acetyltransferase